MVAGKGESVELTVVVTAETKENHHTHKTQKRN